jgi:2-polyprenyl-3-methyl-5-hydroxy-6-metoxy-1,4-benzoquinol methylase
VDSKYDDEKYIEQRLQLRTHRQIVGGLWEEIGTLQFEFMQRIGLRPESLLLDVGCGALRGGVKFVEYLNGDHYFGIDISQSLLETGYAQEIAPRQDLADKLPQGHLKCIDTFDAASFGKQFDYALAQSVFTHLTLNSIRLCLENLAQVVKLRGKFCATYFRAPDDQPTGVPQHHRLGVVTCGYKDPYHYRVADFRYVIRGLPWALDDELEWGHPRGQRMLVFSKTA